MSENISVGFLEQRLNVNGLIKVNSRRGSLRGRTLDSLTEREHSAVADLFARLIPERARRIQLEPIVAAIRRCFGNDYASAAASELEQALVGVPFEHVVVHGGKAYLNIFPSVNEGSYQAPVQIIADLSQKPFIDAAGEFLSLLPSYQRMVAAAEAEHSAAVRNARDVLAGLERLESNHSSFLEKKAEHLGMAGKAGNKSSAHYALAHRIDAEIGVLDGQLAALANSKAAAEAAEIAARKKFNDVSALLSPPPGGEDLTGLLEAASQAVRRAAGATVIPEALPRSYLDVDYYKERFLESLDVRRMAIKASLPLLGAIGMLSLIALGISGQRIWTNWQSQVTSEDKLALRAFVGSGKVDTLGIANISPYNEFEKVVAMADGTKISDFLVIGGKPYFTLENSAGKKKYAFAAFGEGFQSQNPLLRDRLVMGAWYLLEDNELSVTGGLADCANPDAVAIKFGVDGVLWLKCSYLLTLEPSPGNAELKKALRKGSLVAESSRGLSGSVINIPKTAIDSGVDAAVIGPTGFYFEPAAEAGRYSLLITLAPPAFTFDELHAALSGASAAKTETLNTP